MSGSTFGKFLKIITFGESHGPYVGVVMDGVRPNIPISKEEIERELKRRRPSFHFSSTDRKERDEVEILSGVFEGKTTGHPICIVVKNKNYRSEDYENIKNLFRPGHADFALFKKYGIRDFRGGGRLSGRETVGRVIAGSICKKILSEYKIHIYGGVIQIGDVQAEIFDRNFVEKNPLKFSDPGKFREAEKLLKGIKKRGDSIGGKVKIFVEGLMPGIGDPVFDKLDALLTAGIMSIGSVKGVEIGRGFKVSEMKGSENNDQFSQKGFLTNNSGGILGGISNGDRIEITFSVKPTPSISIEQSFLSETGDIVKGKIAGRHDLCICPRIVPVAESMVAIVLTDSILYQEKIKNMDEIEKKRMIVDLIDVEILNLLSQRFKVTGEIMELKIKNKKPAFSKDREEEILNLCREFSEISGVDEEKIIKIYKKILELSKRGYEESK